MGFIHASRARAPQVFSSRRLFATADGGVGEHTAHTTKADGRRMTLGLEEDEPTRAHIRRATCHCSLHPANKKYLAWLVTCIFHFDVLHFDSGGEGEGGGTLRLRISFNTHIDIESPLATGYYELAIYMLYCHICYMLYAKNLH